MHMETTNCPKAKLGKESEFATVGLCKNCGQPVGMSSQGIYVRSQRFSLIHISQSEYEAKVQRAIKARELTKSMGF